MFNQSGGDLAIPAVSLLSRCSVFGAYCFAGASRRRSSLILPEATAGGAEPVVCPALGFAGAVVCAVEVGSFGVHRPLFRP